MDIIELAKKLFASSAYTNWKTSYRNLPDMEPDATMILKSRELAWEIITRDFPLTCLKWYEAAHGTYRINLRQQAVYDEQQQLVWKKPR